MDHHSTVSRNFAAVLSITLLGCSGDGGNADADADPLGQGTTSASAAGVSEAVAGAPNADTPQPASQPGATSATSVPSDPAAAPSALGGIRPEGSSAPTENSAQAEADHPTDNVPKAGPNAGGASAAAGASTMANAGDMSGGEGGAFGDSGSDGGGSDGGGSNGNGSGVGGNSGELGTPTEGETPITVWLAGDSTVRNDAPCVGWGDAFADYFNDNVTVMNSALAGRGIRQWLYYTTDTLSGDECTVDVDGNGQPLVQDRWQNMLDNMGPGDYLLIQFGINDGAACPRYTSEAQYPLVLGMMAEAAKARGAHPIFLTAVSAIACSGSTATPTRGSSEPGSKGYVDETFQAGVDYDVPVIDLHQLSIELYNELAFCPVPGGDVSASTTGAVGDFFCDDHTHFEATGASEIAGLVAQAVVDQGIGLGAYRL